MTTDLGGVLAVFQTPYLDDWTIDSGTLEHEIRWIFDSGATGVVMAMVSEVLRMSKEERDRLTSLVCRVGKPRGTVVVSVGAESTELAIQHARHAEDAGADAVMAIPPVTVVLSEPEILQYYEGILDSMALPVIVQDAGSYVGRPMSIGVQAKLAERHGDRVMYKPEARPIGPRLEELLLATRGRARAFDGSGGIALLDTYRLGVVGTMPGADLCPAVVALWEALESGDDDLARAIHEPLAALVSLADSLDAFLVIGKHLLVRQGVFVNTLVRGPVAFALDEAIRWKVDQRFDLLCEAMRS